MHISGSRLRVKQDGSITRIEFIDRNILDEANIQLIAEEISQIIDQEQTPKLLISFADVDHLSSAALGALITVNKKIREHNGELRLAKIDPQIFEVFRITKLDQLFQIHDSIEEAIASFAT